MGKVVHPYRVKSIRIAKSLVMDTLGEVFRELDFNTLIKLEIGWYESVIRAIDVVARVSHLKDINYVYYCSVIACYLLFIL